MDQAEQLDHNLTNHTPSPERIADIEQLRKDAKLLGFAILNRCPNSRERSLAMTHLEETVMWAVASIAREVRE